MSPVALPSATAAVLYAPRDIRIEDRTLWPPTHGQVQLQVLSTGLCGSDLHYYTHGRNGDFAVRSPLVLGHEAAGVVTAIGPGVTDFYIGQRVAIEAGINCRSCPMCDKGRYNLCKNMRFCSSASRFPHVDGTLRTRMNHPAHVLHPLPDACTFELASLAEPLSVLIHASRRVGLQANQNILVFGVGAIGLLACALAKHSGAARVMAIDINKERLDFAKKHGFCDDVWCPPSSSSAPAPQHTHVDACHPPPASKLNGAAKQPPPVSPSEESLRRAKESATAALSHFDAQDGFDIVFECTGSAEAIQTSVFAATAGGKVMLIGMGARNVLLPLSTAALREIDILGSFRYANTYPEALSLLASPSPRIVNGKPQIHLPDLVAKMVTHRFTLSDTKRAFELMREGRDDKGGLVLKVVVGTGSPS